FRDVVAPTSPRSDKKSFAEVVNSMEELPQPTMRNGIPGIQFPEEVISSFAEPFKFTLVGKISGRRVTVPNQSIHAAFAKLPLSQSFKLRFLPRNFLIITLTNEGDYSRLWTMGGLHVGALAIRLSKWTPEFKLEAESPIAPVWIRFPELPVHLYNKKGLYALAKILGNPIKIDDFIADETRGSFALVCVELNVLEQHPKQIWVGWGEHSQVINVILERPPSYCLDCKIIGHSTTSCYAHGKNPRPPRSASHTKAAPNSKAPHPPPTPPSPTPPPQPADAPPQPAPTRGRGRGPHRGRGRPRRPVAPRAPSQEATPGTHASHNPFEVLTSLPEETDTTAINPTLDPSPLPTKSVSPNLTQNPAKTLRNDLGGKVALSWDKASPSDALQFPPLIVSGPHPSAKSPSSLDPSICLHIQSGHPNSSPTVSPLQISSSLMSEMISRQGQPSTEIGMVALDVVSHDGSDIHRSSTSCDGTELGRSLPDTDMHNVLKRKMVPDAKLSGLSSQESTRRSTRSHSIST
ncbi:hypothetical protein F511_21457, partial [Dorcoceras hygrometricum]